jgi:lipopolysaccharide transport system ATP-binding protein
MGAGGGAAVREWPDVSTSPGDDQVRLRAIRVIDEHGDPAPETDIRNPVFIEVEYWNLVDDPNFRPFANVHLFNSEGICLFITLDSNNQRWRNTPRRQGLVRARCRIPGNFLAEGGHLVTAAVTSLSPMVVHLQENDATAFHVIDRSEGDGVRAEWAGDLPGAVRPLLDWDVREIDSS